MKWTDLLLPASLETRMTARPLISGIGSLPPPEEPVDAALRAAVALQRSHGFGLYTDGEPRGDMLSYYTALPGIEDRGGVPRVVGRIRALDDPAAFSKVRDLEFVQSAYPGLPIKVALTAPSTFLLACAATGAGPAYKSALDPALHDDLMEALRPIAHAIGRRGAHLQLDDPILSQGMRDFGPALRRLDAIAGEVPRERTSLHVCGSLARTKTLPALFGLQHVSTLNLAFAGRTERANLSLLDARDWTDHDMELGAGCIAVQVAHESEVMPARAVATLLGDILHRVGADRLRYVLPDCGLRATPRELVPELLANLRDGVELAATGAA